MPIMQAVRYHDISTGHRVVGHENKCRHLHGHNYRIHFHCQAEALDALGRVIDFGVIKEKLCMWVENNWDHKFLAWDKDTLINNLTVECSENAADSDILEDSLVFVEFNPTAENMAKHLVEAVGPAVLAGTGIQLIKVVIDETAKCSASYEDEVTNGE